MTTALAGNGEPMKLIDANKVIKALQLFNDHKHGNEDFFCGLETAKEIIENMEEAVIECENCPSLGINKFYPECIFTLDKGLKLVKTGVIVRCKDCLFFESGIRCALRNEQTGYNDYCSKGRRIDG